MDSHMSKPQQPPLPPSYMQSQYNTSGSYGVQPGFGAQPPPPPPPPVMVTPGVPPMGGTTVIVGAQPRRIFSKHPTSVVCQHCNTPVVTQPRAEIGLTTWAIAGLMILVGLWLGCCLIPFCIDECKDIHHDCPNCHQTIEIYKHM